MWAQLEHDILQKDAEHTEYSLFPNRFVRSITLPTGGDYTAEQIAAAVSEYVNLLDASIKAYINGEKDKAALKKDYVRYMQESDVLV